MAELTQLAEANGITRSLLVERSMIALINQQTDGEPILGLGGRYIAGIEKQADAPLGTPDSFKKLWGRVIGGEPAPTRPGGFPREPKPARRTPQPPGWVKPSAGDRSGNPDDDFI
ncbi:MAG: hypothetical protein J0G33_03785 [Afipia felis]|nr:hypothetical protein [Afipia felis]